MYFMRSTGNDVLNAVSQGTCIPPMAKLSHYRKRLDDPRLSPREAENIKQVACQFHDDGSDARFPHVMQQLYRCFSYWQDYHGKEPFMVLPDENVEKKLRKHPFVNGMIEIFEEQMQVETYLNNVFGEKALDQLRKVKNVDIQSFDGIGNYSIRHAHYLHYFARHQLNLDDTGASTCEHFKPRIAILNRNNNKSSRRSTSLDTLQLVNNTEIKELSRNGTVDIKYFEEADFREQVTFFRSVDILVSPHGAHLVGVAFMNAPCSHVLEVFTKRKPVPGFYGSLALDSEKDYTYLDMNQTKAQDLCPSSDMIVDTVRTLVDRWRMCCDLRSRAGE